jgi:hypothetical protein
MLENSKRILTILKQKKKKKKKPAPQPKVALFLAGEISTKNEI